MTQCFVVPIFLQHHYTIATVPLLPPLLYLYLTL